MNDSVVWDLQHQTIIFIRPRYDWRIFFWLSRACFYVRAQAIMSARAQNIFTSIY